MMQPVFVGDTDIAVSRIGLGTVKFGRNQGVHYPESFELPNDHTILDLLTCAEDCGINLLDTAPAYGTSEERLGKLLKSKRHHWVLCTKVGEEFINGQSQFDFSEKTVRLSIERSLRRLKTDFLDIVLVHSNGDDVNIIEQHNIFETLHTLKKSGTIRAFGMSTKTIEGGKLTIEQADVAMVTYNPMQQADQPIISYAQQKNKGIFIKKGLVSGHLQKIESRDPVLAAMQCIFKESGVTSLIVGTLNPNHLQQNVKTAEQALLELS